MRAYEVEVEQDERANEVEEAKPSPPNGGGGGSDEKPEEVPRAIGLPRAPSFTPFSFKEEKKKKTPPSISPRYGSNACSAPTLAEIPHPTPYPTPSAAFKGNPHRQGKGRHEGKRRQNKAEKVTKFGKMKDRAIAKILLGRIREEKEGGIGQAASRRPVPDRSKRMQKTLRLKDKTLTEIPLTAI